MSYELDQVVNVNISLQAAGISQAGFGVPLICGPNGTTEGQIITIASASELTQDHGYLVTDAEYLKAVAFFAQNPSVATVRVCKISGVSATEKHVSIIGAWTTGDLALEVQGQEASASFSSDEDTSMGLLATAIAGLDGVSACTYDSIGGKLEITSDAGLGLSVKASSLPSGVTGINQEVQTGSSSVEADLNALTAQDKDFYAVLVASDADADIKSLLSYANANGKLMFAKTNDVLAEEAGEEHSLAYDLNNASESRAVLVYQNYSQRNQQADAAFAGIGLPTVPGSITWKFKTPVGISQVQVSVGANAELMSKGVNIVTRSNNVNFTKEGTTSSGQFIDITRGIDWLEARLQENILSLQLNNGKIPYTNAGLSLVGGAIREILRLGSNNGLLNDDFSISVPDVSSVLANDKANRILKNVTFVASLQGAIHKIEINGTVTV